MKRVTIIAREPNLTPQFIKTELVTYEREGKQAFWEKTKVHNTVHVLVKNVDTNELLLVKQTRIPVLVEQPETHGVTIEACAGIIDCFEDKASVPQLRAKLVAKAEVYEELGYEVSLYDLTSLPKYIGSTGGSGSTCYPFYCEVTNDQSVGQHLGDDEDIEIVTILEKDVRLFAETTNMDATTRYLLYWYLSK